MEFRGELENEKYRFFLTGGVSLGEYVPPKNIDWLSKKAWEEAVRLSKFENFENFYQHLEDNQDSWAKIYNSPTPYL